MLHNFWLSIHWVKKEQFLQFQSLSILSPEFGYNWILTTFWPKSPPSYLNINLLRRQTEPIIRIGAILVSVKQSKKFQCFGEKNEKIKININK